MVANIGRIDRCIRIALGIVLLSVVLLATGHWRWIGLLGALPLASGLVGWCPFYAWLTQD